MGAETACRLTSSGRTTDGKALLETEELIFRPAVRGGPRLTVRFADIRAMKAVDGRLTIDHAGGTAVFEIGAAAAKWLEKIKNPRSRLDKLGVKPGQRVAVVGTLPDDFMAELRGRVPDVAPRPAAETDLIFFAADRRESLAKLAPLAKKLKETGAIWVIRPKGSDAIREVEVFAAGRAAGLVAVKVAAFAPTHTADKLVIPVSRR
jgi:hypothetical protein